MNNLFELHTMKCVACEGGVPPIPRDELRHYLEKIPGWQLSEDYAMISKNFMFKGFYKTISFVNVVAWIANQEGHHPLLEVGVNHCLVKYTTNAISALTSNDFICAAKIEQIAQRDAI
ncbi:MAG: 4a-hydroxytetrahydrobiopterin dehydratase [Oligoflexia bacterium]|nr:4a-hydroxytetrahydrobiopterin dehydratase [Oligoflexia bacterium]MBF0366940.1 4a-hydroxytetrahydrobiopterin dehydratase [Oligoflexia bacterium]